MSSIESLNYREIFQNANDAMIVHDGVTGAILETNEAACRLFGHSAKDMCATSIGALSVGDPEIREEIALRYIRQAVEAGGLFNFEWIIRHSSGTPIAIEGNLKRMRGHTRPLVLAISRDISERKLAELRLRERGRYFEELLRNSSDGVALIAADGCVKYMGESLAGIAGFPSRAILGRNVFTLLHPADVPRLFSLLAKARRKMVNSGTVSYRVLHRDGSWRSHEAVFKNLLDDPAFSAVLVNYRDVTERLRHEEQLRERERQLNHYARLSIAGEAAAALAHELNQPLFAAVNFFAGCRRRLEAGAKDSTEIEMALTLAQAELERAGRVIQSVRNFTANHPASRNRHSVSAILNGILSFLRIRAEQDSVTITTHITKDAFVECDEVLIQQVISNLVVNAIEAMTDLPVDARAVSISVEIESGYVRIIVKDSGCGFSSESLEAAGRAFFTTKENGVGLGLSLCRTIVGSHGGKMACEQGESTGGKVSFTLPITL
ncbi:PAS domain S-box protein [Achromobacter aegrifaciens]